MNTNACTSGSGAPMGTKTGAQCLESVTVLYFLAKDGFTFDDINAFKDKTAWDAAILNKDVVPLFELYDLANANTDATYYENRNFRKRTAKATKVLTAEVYLSLCAQKILKSYEGSEYNQLFEITEDGWIIGVYDSDMVKIKGQTIKNFDVGIRNNATVDKVPFTVITITFADYEELESRGVMVDPNFDPLLDLNGLQEIALHNLVGTTTEISFNASLECTDAPATDLVGMSFDVIDPNGVSQTVVAAAGTDPGEYTLTGVFVAGTNLVGATTPHEGTDANYVVSVYRTVEIA